MNVKREKRRFDKNTIRPRLREHLPDVNVSVQLVGFCSDASVVGGDVIPYFSCEFACLCLKS
jgi:hypothetical protein